MDLQQYYTITINNQEHFLSDPQGLTMDTFKDLYIVDQGLDSVVKINVLGKVEWKKGFFGNSVESLNNPMAVAIGQNQNWFVADQGNKRVKEYDQTPELVGVIDDLIDPRDICYKNGQLFVADAGTINIYRDRQLVEQITSFNNEVFTPQAIYCTDQELFVLDALRRQILIYALY